MYPTCDFLRIQFFTEIICRYECECMNGNLSELRCADSKNCWNATEYKKSYANDDTTKNLPNYVAEHNCARKEPCEMATLPLEDDQTGVRFPLRLQITLLWILSESVSNLCRNGTMFPCPFLRNARICSRKFGFMTKSSSTRIDH